MGEFLRIAHGIDTMPIMLDLMRAPDLWDQNRTRTTFEGTPHGQSSDIWVRFRSPVELEGPQSHKEEYRCVNWPAWHRLPSLRPLIRALKHTVDAVELGSILVTRLPPGATILPHSDQGSWAAERYNTKLHVTLAGRSHSICGDELVEMVAGDVWTFDNLRLHSVVNPDDGADRVALIASMRCEP